MLRTIGIAVLAAVTLTACDGGGAGGGAAARDHIKIVGSSTVYPFATAVAEGFVNKNPGMKPPVIEQNGTGAGMKQFCAGLGAGHPDINNASRQMTRSEYDECVKNGVTKIVEVQVGIDGITLVQAKAGPEMSVTPVDVYRALAANPYGSPNTAKTWRDVNPSLPATPIVVYGPPASSGTRDAFAELILTRGCEANPQMTALAKTDEAKHKAICTELRTDGGYVESGENDNLIVQKLGANPNAIGVLGYSFLAENLDTLKGVSISGVTPTYETISNFSYPGARPLYIYVKADHLNAIKGLKEYVAEWAASWNPDGNLAKRGLIATPDATRSTFATIAEKMTLMDASSLQ